MTGHEGMMESSMILVAASVVGVSAIVVVFLGCMWCRNKWKGFTHGHYRLSQPQRETSPVANLTEFTIFPPPMGNQVDDYASRVTVDEVVFEPLPEIRSRVIGSLAEHIRPARFTGTCEKISLQDWFDEHQVNFPRTQLKYFQEVGNTWYGQAVDGEAFGLLNSEDKTRVVVKILRIDATSTELMQYLQETRALRYLNHPCLLRLHGRCLEMHPFLLIMEHCDTDLKSYLIAQRKCSEVLLKNGILLGMACNIASALQFMHENFFVHMDVAAHNCLVTSDGIVKLGDYGTAVHVHRSDFYCLGDVAFPIRWCAPESLTCTDSMIEAKDITRAANIWSFGVVLWELLEFGKLPYFELSDNEVIQRVLMECNLRLAQPLTPCVHKDMIYKIMQLCWLPASMRPTAHKVCTLLNYLYNNREVVSETSAFESRWSLLQPSTIPRDHNLQNTGNVSLRFESDFIPRGGTNTSDQDSMISASEFGMYGDKSPSSGSFSLELAPEISPSLLNLRGSMDDLIADSNSETDQSDRRNSLQNSLPNGGGVSDETPKRRRRSMPDYEATPTNDNPSARLSSTLNVKDNENRQPVNKNGLDQPGGKNGNVDHAQINHIPRIAGSQMASSNLNVEELSCRNSNVLNKTSDNAEPNRVNGDSVRNSDSVCLSSASQSTVCDDSKLDVLDQDTLQVEIHEAIRNLDTILDGEDEETATKDNFSLGEFTDKNLNIATSGDSNRPTVVLNNNTVGKENPTQDMKSDGLSTFVPIDYD